MLRTLCVCVCVCVCLCIYCNYVGDRVESRTSLGAWLDSISRQTVATVFVDNSFCLRYLARLI